MRASNGMERSAQRVNRQRRRDVRDARQARRPEHREREKRRARLRAVDEGEAFLRRERYRPQTGLGERVGAGASVERVAFADEHQRQVRERGEVAAGADRSARRHAGVHAGVEQRDERLDGLDANSGVALGEHVRAQRE